MSNWRAIILESDEKRLTFRLSGDDKPLAHKEFLELLSENKPFIKWYNQFLASTNFDAFFWENMPVTTNNLDEIYECTLVKSATLAHVSPDQSTFDSYFERDKNAVSFPNLGGDAQLVVPCPVSSDSTLYTQIGSFVRQAPDNQITDFWRMVGKEMLDSIQNQPRWLSTSGLVVYWLHARIDSVPKYYQTEAYKTV
jgi:hypothetical protein